MRNTYIHFRVLFLEAAKRFLLLELIGRRKTCCLLALIKHHLFNKRPRFKVQVGKLAIFRDNSLGIDLWMTLDDA